MDLSTTPGYVPGFHDELNLRELGGNPTADGRTVKHGLIYRSGALFDASSDELELLEGLGLHYVLDLRSEEEAAAEPDPQLTGAEQVRISGCMDADDNEVNLSPASIVNLLKNPRRIDKDEEDSIESSVAEIYTSLAFDNIAYRELFAQLEQGNVPLLFHCSGGKDRTGIAAMLILLALGVDDQTIVANYVLTNEYRRDAIQRKLDEHPVLTHIDKIELIIRAGEGVLQPFGERVLSEIKQEYGTYEIYFEKEYGLDATRIAALRDRYTE